MTMPRLTHDEGRLASRIAASFLTSGFTKAEAIRLIVPYLTWRPRSHWERVWDSLVKKGVVGKGAPHRHEGKPCRRRHLA